MTEQFNAVRNFILTTLEGSTVRRESAAKALALLDDYVHKVERERDEARRNVLAVASLAVDPLRTQIADLQARVRWLFEERRRSG
jgi:hypothetical protein